MKIIIQNQNGKDLGEFTIEHDQYSSLNYIDTNQMCGVTLEYHLEYLGVKEDDIDSIRLVYETEDEPIILKLNRYDKIRIRREVV